MLKVTFTEKNSAINQDMPLTTDHLDHCVSNSSNYNYGSCKLLVFGFSGLLSKNGLHMF